MDVELPDGKIVRGVPEGTTKDQLAQKLKANGITVGSPAAAAPKENAGESEPVSAGRTALDQGLQGATYGVSDEVDDAIGALGARAYTGYKNTVPELLGGEPGKYEGDTLGKEYSEARTESKSRLGREEKQHPGISTASQIAGAVALPGPGEAKLLDKALPAAIGGSKAAGRVAKGLVGGTVGGAAAGAGSAPDDKRVEGAVEGAESGLETAGALTGATEGLTKVAAPAFKKSVELLRKEGVTLTPGQLMGGVAKTGESAVTSVPMLGDMVKNGVRNSIESFNTAVWNRALKPIGAKIPKDVAPGQESVRFVGDQIGKKYDALIPKLSLNIDSQAMQDFKNLNGSQVQRLTEGMQKQFESLVNNILSPRVDSTLKMTGEDFKRIDSELGYESRNYTKSENPEHKGLGEALTQVRSILRNNLERSNPAHEKELQSINSAWAMYKRAEAASIRRVAAQGVFMPSDLLSDIKKTNSSGVFARGDGVLQDLAQAGQDVLPSSLPSSGTTERALWGILLGGGAHFNPLAAAGAAAASSAYTKPGMEVINKLGTGPRRAAVRSAIEQASPAISAAGGTAAGENQEEAPQ